MHTGLAAGLAVALLALAGCGADDPGTTATSASPSASSSAPTATTSAPSPTTSTPAPTTAKPKPKPKPKPSKATSTTSTSPTALAPVPAKGAQPTVRFPKNQPAQGGGANAQVSAIPDSVWQRMVGYSWTKGCPVGRSGLRYVTVNFWGFDGKRSRGAIVVNKNVASATARAFTRLYEQQFRIRQMRPMDSTWGKNPKGPGANDYAAMDADNTSAFNCRYVGGEEERKQYSNHAYGSAIDVNDFENPYIADGGTIYPDAYYAHRRSPAPGVFSSSSSAAVRAFTREGMTWGGRWSHPDYQHFDAR
ncbi:M15 family metallopeptidase [Angustibacter luteus]|uniref:M15 family metallopeptidase n=1 Tax=Angustibacter luteus TaxID=658456 RepID=A0ABW1JG18_9ACTN